MDLNNIDNMYPSKLYTHYLPNMGYHKVTNSLGSYSLLDATDEGGNKRYSENQEMQLEVHQQNPDMLSFL